MYRHLNMDWWRDHNALLAGLKFMSYLSYTNSNGIFKNINELQLFLNENQVEIAIISDTHLINKSTFKKFGYKFIIY